MEGEVDEVNKENRPVQPSLSLEQKHERMLMRLQRRNSSVLARKSVIKSSTSFQKTQDDGKVLHMKALTEWINTLLKPSTDFDIGDEASVETLLSKGSGLDRLKNLLSTISNPAAHDSFTTAKQLSKEQPNNLIQYFLKRASPVNLARKVESLLHSTNTEIGIQRIVDQGKLAVRPDVKVFSNLGVQALLCSILLNFQPIWLRLALEFVFKKKIDFSRCANTKFKYMRIMSAFIYHNLFANFSILQDKRKYISGQSRFLLTDTGAQVMHKYFLTKFFTLLYAIEVMVMNNLIPDVPCMFWTSSVYKSINDVLPVISRELLTGASSVKQLHNVGFVPVYQQGFFEEYNFMVENFPTDFCDGVIFSKVVEILSFMKRRDIKLISQLRNPNGDRLRKIYNVRCLLTTCVAQFPGHFNSTDFTAEEIVAGKCDRVVEFVWRLIGVVLGDEASKLRQEFIEKYQLLGVKSSTIATNHDDLLQFPFLVEMRRLNIAATRIQRWWRTRLILRRSQPEDQIVDKSLHSNAGDIQFEIECYKKFKADLNSFEFEDGASGKLICENLSIRPVDEKSFVNQGYDMRDRDAENLFEIESASNSFYLDAEKKSPEEDSNNKSLRHDSAQSFRDNDTEKSSHDDFNGMSLQQDAEKKSSHEDSNNKSLQYDSAQSFRDNDTEKSSHDDFNGMSLQQDVEKSFQKEKYSQDDSNHESRLHGIVQSFCSNNARSDGTSLQLDFEQLFQSDTEKKTSQNDSNEQSLQHDVDAKKDGSDGKLLWKDVGQSFHGYEKLSEFRAKALKITENTLLARNIISRPRAQSDGVSSQFSYAEFKRHLDERRRDARFVGIPMRRPDGTKK